MRFKDQNNQNTHLTQKSYHRMLDIKSEEKLMLNFENFCMIPQGLRYRHEATSKTKKRKL